MLTDSPEPRRTVARRPAFEGAIWSVHTHQVDLGDGHVVARDVVEHPGAVAVAAFDEAGRLVMVRQYRHPVRSRLWELPAGLLDVAGEPLLQAAQRELAEEAGLVASSWSTLIDMYTSPGGSSERIRVFLAEGLGPSGTVQGFTAADEEADLEVARYPLDEVVAAIRDGRLHNGVLIAAAMALRAAPGVGRRHLRPADAPWLCAAED